MSGEPSARRVRAFTLIEAMVMVSVIATFALLGYPRYSRYVLETGRSDAYAALLDLATREETHFHAYNTYTDVIVAAPGCTGAACGLGAREVSAQGYYELSVTPGRTRDIETSYVLTARVKPGLRQAADEECAVLTINWLGETQPATCW
jgi:Tfp pilus assembly protein PilE